VAANSVRGKLAAPFLFPGAPLTSIRYGAGRLQLTDAVGIEFASPDPPNPGGAVPGETSHPASTVAVTASEAVFVAA